MNNLSLNPDKIQFKSTDCKFFGHRLTPEGLKPDPEKIKAILAMQPLQSIQQLQSFNGMVNYLKRFSPVLSELAEPLRKLQKSDTVWAWESEQQTAFEKTKTVLTTLPVLAYFDKNKDHIIQTDASKTGLGAVLLQEGQPVVYASRTLLAKTVHDGWPKIIKDCPHISSHIGIFEMKSHVKMVSCRKELD